MFSAAGSFIRDQGRVAEDGLGKQAQSDAEPHVLGETFQISRWVMGSY